MLPSASRIHRVMICPASDVLPQVDDADGGLYASKGSALHAYLYNVLQVGKEDALAQIDDAELRGSADQLPLDDLPYLDPKSFRAEIAIGYSPARDEARVLGENIGRHYLQYGLLNDEIPMSVDVAGIAVRDRKRFVVFADWKTGIRRCIPAQVNWQIRTCAIGLARAYDADGAAAALVYVRDDRERPFSDRAWFDALDLAVINDELLDMLARRDHARATFAAGAQPPLVVGQHCAGCPAFRACPAQVDLLRSAAATADAARQTENDLRGMLRDDDATSAYHLWRRLHLLDKVLGEAVHNFAIVRPITVSDGVVYGPAETGSEELDGKVARYTLEERIYDLLVEHAKASIVDQPNAIVAHEALHLAARELAEQACTFETTKAAIRDAAKAVAARIGSKIAPVERFLLTALRDAGGVRVKDGLSVKERKITDVDRAKLTPTTP